MNTATVVSGASNYVGPLDFFFLSYAVLVVLVVVGAVWGGCALYDLYQKHKSEVRIQRAEESYALIGAEASVPVEALKQAGKYRRTH